MQGAVRLRQRLDGLVIGTMVPDWMAGMWKLENPGLAGKVKLMPLPAWTKGGRRTSVAGGTMIGFSKKSTNLEVSWELAKYLYLSPELAEHTFTGTSVISPIKTLWHLPFYDKPDPFFGGQPIGRMYINQAESVPRRPSSPYTDSVTQSLASAAISLRRIQAWR